MERNGLMVSSLKESLEQDGFVHIANPFTTHELETFRAACEDAVSLTRQGSWPHLRSLPKQFPPWTNDASQGIWGVQHLLHPEMPGRDVFAASYFHDVIVKAVTSILTCKEDELVLELYNLLTRPDRDFALRWHRDNIGPEVLPEEELKLLQDPMMHAQWNLALYEDRSLIVVPGSHRRARTDVERNADPFEDNLLDQKIVVLHPGDIVFYNNNILHRGVYQHTTPRMTLHGSMGVVGSDRARARVILQHGIGEWVRGTNFERLPRPTTLLAETMKQNLIAIGTGKEDLGFAQQD